MPQTRATESFRSARDLLVARRDDHGAAVREFRWPDVGDTFNWGIDWFDAIARGNTRPIHLRRDGHSL
jgi:acetyl-CoA synthetase